MRVGLDANTPHGLTTSPPLWMVSLPVPKLPTHSSELFQIEPPPSTGPRRSADIVADKAAIACNHAAALNVEPADCRALVADNQVAGVRPRRADAGDGDRPGRAGEDADMPTELVTTPPLVTFSVPMPTLPTRSSAPCSTSTRCRRSLPCRSSQRRWRYNPPYWRRHRHW